MRWRIECRPDFTTLARLAMGVTLALGMLAVVSPARTDGPANDNDAPAKAKADAPRKEAPKPPAVKLGLSINDPRALQGYTLLASLQSTKTYLIDMQGKVVRTWDSKHTPGASAYLLENGHLFRTASLGGETMAFGGGPGAGGKIEEFTWDGQLAWDFKFYNPKQLPHHDAIKMPNGNVLMIVWDKKTTQEALAAGRRPELVGDTHMCPDSLVEIKPTGKTTGEVVWEWHLWDHLVQDFDPTKANYGNVAAHPELVNVNYGEDEIAAVLAKKGGADKLKSIGYVGANTAAGRPQRANPDWTHFNCVTYNADLDQVMVSVHAFSEFWIIDHGTTTAEAASHKGGRQGKGGDLLYRWGNPRAYHAGKKEDQRLFAQHNAHWIPPGLPGEGHVLVFNNGRGRPGGDTSSVDELILPVDPSGHYTSKPGAAYGPDGPAWSYAAPKKSDFYSSFISGAQRLPNGNTLICSGANGIIFEVTPEKEIVWKYINPVKVNGPGPGGFGPPQPGQIMPGFVQDMLKLTADQKKQMDALQKHVDGQLDKLLTSEQKKLRKEGPRVMFFPPGAALPKAGEILAAADQDRLKLTAPQKQQLADLQKDVDKQLATILKEDQRKQLKDMEKNFAFGPGGPGGPGGPVQFPAPSQPGQLVSAFAQDQLKLTAEQKKQLAAFQKDVDGQLDKLLTEEQKKQFKDPEAGGSTPAGQIMALAVQTRLKLTADQRKSLQKLQKEADGTLAKVLTDEQKKELKQLAANRGRGPGGPPGGAVRFGPGGGPPGGGPPGGPGGFGPPGGTSIFRAYRYAASYSGFVGKDLAPGKTIEEIQAKDEKKTASAKK
jgi:Spy/CpxP family protein refolding chaperone